MNANAGGICYRWVGKLKNILVHPIFSIERPGSRVPAGRDPEAKSHGIMTLLAHRDIEVAVESIFEALPDPVILADSEGRNGIIVQ